MEEWGRPDRPRSGNTGTLQSRNNVPPEAQPWEPTDRCPAGECVSEDRVRWRAGLDSLGDFAAVRCYHCRHGVCVECGVGPTPAFFQFCKACDCDSEICNRCGDRHEGDCCAAWGGDWMLALDTETTGKNPHSAELVSVALVEYRCSPKGEESVNPQVASRRRVHNSRRRRSRTWDYHRRRAPFGPANWRRSRGDRRSPRP